MDYGQDGEKYPWQSTRRETTTVWLDEVLHRGQVVTMQDIEPRELSKDRSGSPEGVSHDKVKVKGKGKGKAKEGVIYLDTDTDSDTAHPHPNDDADDEDEDTDNEVVIPAKKRRLDTKMSGSAVEPIIIDSDTEVTPAKRSMSESEDMNDMEQSLGPARKAGDIVWRFPAGKSSPAKAARAGRNLTPNTSTLSEEKAADFDLTPRSSDPKSEFRFTFDAAASARPSSKQPAPRPSFPRTTSPAPSTSSTMGGTGEPTHPASSSGPKHSKAPALGNAAPVIIAKPAVPRPSDSSPSTTSAQLHTRPSATSDRPPHASERPTQDGNSGQRSSEVSKGIARISTAAISLASSSSSGNPKTVVPSSSPSTATAKSTPSTTTSSQGAVPPPQKVSVTGAAPQNVLFAKASPTFTAASQQPRPAVTASNSVTSTTKSASSNPTGSTGVTAMTPATSQARPPPLSTIKPAKAGVGQSGLTSSAGATSTASKPAPSKAKGIASAIESASISTSPVTASKAAMGSSTAPSTSPASGPSPALSSPVKRSTTPARPSFLAGSTSIASKQARLQTTGIAPATSTLSSTSITAPVIEKARTSIPNTTCSGRPAAARPPYSAHPTARTPASETGSIGPKSRTIVEAPGVTAIRATTAPSPSCSAGEDAYTSLPSKVAPPAHHACVPPWQQGAGIYVPSVGRAASAVVPSNGTATPSTDLESTESARIGSEVQRVESASNVTAPGASASPNVARGIVISVAGETPSTSLGSGLKDKGKETSKRPVCANSQLPPNRPASSSSNLGITTATPKIASGSTSAPRHISGPRPRAIPVSNKEMKASLGSREADPLNAISLPPTNEEEPAPAPPPPEPSVDPNEKRVLTMSLLGQSREYKIVSKETVRRSVQRMATDVGFYNDAQILARFGSTSISKSKKLYETRIWDALGNNTHGDPARVLELTVDEVTGPAISLLCHSALPEVTVTISAPAYCE